MTRISALLEAGPSLSFEFSAPRDRDGAARLRTTLQRLARHRPQFMSVTYGAGGSTRGPTREWVSHIRDQLAVEAMPHLTCVTHTRPEVARIIDDYRADGAENILALRGDLPQNADEQPTQAFATAAQLVEFIRERADFDVAVAAHPEGHPMAPSIEADRQHQAAKLGQADFAITQFFYRAEYYERFIDELHRRGVAIPVIPGLMPPTNVAGIERMSRLNNTEFPAELRDCLERAETATERRKIGVETASRLGETLLQAGAPGLHIYTMNFARAASAVATNLGWMPR